MIDIDRVSDLELLRQVAKIQDAEIRRLHDKLTETVRRMAESNGADAADIEAAPHASGATRGELPHDI